MSDYEQINDYGCGNYSCPVCYRKKPKLKKAVKQVTFADLMGRPVAAHDDSTTYTPTVDVVEIEYEEVIRLHRCK